MSDHLKILLLEDDATDAEIVARLLQKQKISCEFKIAASKNDYFQALDNFIPDIILSDHSLPQFNSADALALARQYFPGIPFIMVTGAVSEEFAADIIKLGADDYILKDRMARLPSAINGALRRRQIAKENLEIIEQARHKIELAEERARLAIGAANIGIYDIDLITGILVTSPRYNEIFGFTESRPATDYLALIHPDDIEIRNTAHATSKETGRLSYEVRIIKKDKTLRWIRAEGIIHKNEEKIPVRITGSIMDITEFKFLLKQKDNFIGVASHELKTPVSTIKAYTYILEEMLRKRGDIPEVTLIRSVDKQINRLSLLINNLLDQTIMKSGRLQFNHTNFKIDTMVEETIKSLQVTTDKKIILQLSAGHCKVNSDKDKIEQVITNLVSNAIKFSPRSDNIIVRTFTENNKLILEVQDFGIGIKKEKLGKIFQEFYREDEGFNYTFPGLGLGLYISSEIIKGEGGKIEVKSKEGEGSTFSFSLPCVG